jgi:hypothetical protein
MNYSDEECDELIYDDNDGFEEFEDNGNCVDWSLYHAFKEFEKAQSQFARLLRDPEQQDLWNAFIDAGGFTSKDLACFLDNKLFKRHRLYRQKKHLRLVSSQPTKVIRLRRNKPINPNEAA